MSNSKLISLMVILGIISLGIFAYYFRSTPVSEQNSNIKNSMMNTVGNTNSCQIIALGDSISAGYQLATEKAYPAQLEKKLRENGYDCAVINAGVSGDTSKSLLDRIEFTVADTPYQLAILTIGGNDGLRNLPLEDMNTNIRQIIEKLQSKNIPILLAGMQIPNNAGVYAEEFKNIYPSIANDFKIPLFPFFLEGVAMQENLNLADGIHPNTEGYRIIAENLYIFMNQTKLLESFPKISPKL